ncbi:glycosyltransferase family 4 protein [Paenibacillus sp. FSL H8-0537]|uniref:glycosyltransferase family 4 protein n=1 Tax=Paenibacillus sp. FSL H8-0537 TaxID=2921399 RepID=UPI003100AF9B
MKPNIVFVINYFYPDFASTGQLLTELCLYLQDDFNITVIAAQSEQGEKEAEAKGDKSRIVYDRLEDIQIIRIRLPKVDKRSKASRLRYIASYFFHANIQLLKQKKVHFIYTISQPPILGGLIGTIGKTLKRSKHIYNIQDFNPEQAAAAGYMNNKAVLGLARWVDTLNCKYADHIITVGYDMQDTLLKRFASRRVTDNTVINNWTNEEEIIPLSKEHPQVQAFLREHHWQNKFVIMYSGNLGLYYDLEKLVELASRFRDYPDVIFAFIGEGAVKKQMQDYVQRERLANVAFLPFQPKEQLRYSLNAADVHLVVNQKGIKGVSVPSKIYGVMAAGKPVLGVLEQGSEAYRIIEESGCGIVAEPQQYTEIARKLNAMIELGGVELEELGLCGRDYLEAHLRKEISLNKYRKLLLSI